MADGYKELTLRLYRDYNATALVEDLSQRWTHLTFSSALHGGFKELRTVVPMPLEDAWMWLRREGAPGYHYRHVELTDRLGTVWEGRLMDIGLRMDRGFVGLDLTALGYWSSMRDRLYDVVTDWKISGPHNTGKIIREMITNDCPDINGTVDVELSPEDVVGIDLTGGTAYPMDIIIDKLAPLAGTGTAIYYFSIYGTRKPVWTSRAVTNIHWLVSLQDFERLEIVQQGINVRNYVLPIIATTAGTGSLDAESTANYPRREITLELGTGVPTTAANNARDAMIQERRFPMQSESFTIRGQVFSTRTGNLAQGIGTAMEDRPKWWVRAGDMVRIRDLVPHSAATGTLDNLRTFYILETVYDAGRDVLEIQPDRPANLLSSILARTVNVERHS